MATLNGARALGLDADIGSIEPGKYADLVAVDLSATRTRPLYDVVPQLVYSAAASQVTDVWVAGRALLADGVLTTIDEDAARSEADRYLARLGAARSAPTGA